MSGTNHKSLASIAGFCLLLATLLALNACASEIDIGQPVEVIIVPTQSPTVASESLGAGVTTSGTVLESLTENPDFALFVAGWNRIGRSQLFQSGGPFTVFAPTNVAFSRMGTTSTQLEPAALESLLRHHVINQLVPPEQLATAGMTSTTAGAQLRLGKRGDSLAAGYATVVGEPIVTGNGIIYPIDAVLVPPEPGPEKSIWGLMQDDERLAAVVEAMGGTNSMYLLRFSQEVDAFLAPTSEAMAALEMPAELAGLLRSDETYDSLFAYHVMMPNGWPNDENLPAAEMVARGIVETPLRNPAQFGLLYTVEITQTGDDILVNGARLIETDIPATNGMLQIIDAVLMPPPLAGSE